MAVGGEKQGRVSGECGIIPRPLSIHRCNGDEAKKREEKNSDAIIERVVSRGSRM